MLRPGGKEPLALISDRLDLRKDGVETLGHHQGWRARGIEKSLLERYLEGELGLHFHAARASDSERFCAILYIKGPARRGHFHPANIGVWCTRAELSMYLRNRSPDQDKDAVLIIDTQFVEHVELGENPRLHRT